MKTLTRVVTGAILIAIGLILLAFFFQSCPITTWVARPTETPAPKATLWPTAGGPSAFASSRDGNWEIYVMNPDGSGVTRLTNNSAGDQDPAWSPAFTHERPTTVWQISEFEPSIEGYSVTEQADEFWAEEVDYDYTFRIDPSCVMQDASTFPMDLWYPGSITIQFDLEEEGFYALRYARFGSETTNIILDGVLIHTVAGFADGSDSDFETVLELPQLDSSQHTLKIEIVEGTGDSQVHRFDALALESSAP